jgi:rsbT co-antagonist protein RsbR
LTVGDSEEAMDEPSMPEVEGEILEKIADVLLVLSEVSVGIYRRLESDLPSTHPVGALTQGVNEMIEALEREKQNNAAYQRDLEEKLQTIERQRSSIRELSTPIIEIWDRILCLPIVGVMDTTRSAEMTDGLLKAVVDRAARCAIIDITGIDIMDTGTADHFVRMAKSVKLLGADCVLTGINPHIARTLVQMDVQLTGITTYRSLRTALQRYVSKVDIAKLDA